MGFFNKILGGGKKKEKDEIEKFDERILFEKKVQLESKSDKLLEDLEKTDNQIDSLVESSKGKTQNEKRRIASRIRTLQDKKTALESGLVSIEKQLRARDGIEIIKDGDEISTTGITSEINEEKMEGALIDRRIKALETDAKVTTITQNISKSISSTKIDEDSDEILDMLNKIDEGTLEPEHVKKQLSKNME